MSENPYDFSLEAELENKIKWEEQSELLKINFVIQDGFGVNTSDLNKSERNNKPRVLFQKAKGTLIIWTLD